MSQTTNIHYQHIYQWPAEADLHVSIVQNAARSKAVVLLLLIFCVMYFPLFVEVCSFFVLICITLCPF